MAPEDLRDLLDSQLRGVTSQAGRLSYSLDHLGYPGSLGRLSDDAVLVKYEALTARFARLQDMLLHPFRTLARIELEDAAAERVPDLLALMEERGILEDARAWRTMRDVRNAIAHEYEADAERLRTPFDAVVRYSREMLSVVRRTSDYVRADVR